MLTNEVETWMAELDKEERNHNDTKQTVRALEIRLEMLNKDNKHHRNY